MNSNEKLGNKLLHFLGPLKALDAKDREIMQQSGR
jgi:hypothetical protein